MRIFKGRKYKSTWLEYCRMVYFRLLTILYTLGCVVHYLLQVICNNWNKDKGSIFTWNCVGIMPSVRLSCGIWQKALCQGKLMTIAWQLKLWIFRQNNRPFFLLHIHISFLLKKIREQKYPLLKDWGGGLFHYSFGLIYITPSLWHHVFRSAPLSVFYCFFPSSPHTCLEKKKKARKKKRKNQKPLKTGANVVLENSSFSNQLLPATSFPLTVPI